MDSQIRVPCSSGHSFVSKGPMKALGRIIIIIIIVIIVLSAALAISSGPKIMAGMFIV